MQKNRYLSGIIFTCLIILTAAGCTFFSSKKSSLEPSNGQPVIDLAYCNVNTPSDLCVASFGIENGDKTLVNFIASDPEFPEFNLKIQRNGIQSDYECVRVEDFPTSFYCVGEKISLGETIEMEVVSKTEETLIAKGNLNISFLAVSTSIAMMPKTDTTPSAVTTAATQTPPPQVTATVAVGIRATATPVDTYPNSSYP